MSRYTNFIFTLNNYEKNDETRIAMLGAKYYVYGRESGESGTPHLQGYLHFKNARTMKSMIKKLPGAHIEVRRGSHDQAREYCIKDGDFVEVGDPPQKNGGSSMQERALRNKRLRETDICELVESGDISIRCVPILKKARMILDQEGTAFQAEGTRGIWIYGPPGTGKSHAARHDYGDAYFIKQQNKWWDGYTGEKVVVLDDLDTNVLGHYLKIWADKWSCTGEIKGGTVQLQHETFIVTSNYTIEELWPEDLQMQRAINRRFKKIQKLIKYN